MPAIGDRNPFVLQYLDYSNHVQSIRLYTGEITTGTIAGLLTAMGTLETAMDGVTLGVRSMSAWGEESVLSNTPPSDKKAQTETEFLVRLRGATTEQPFSFRIPTADYEAVNFNGNSDEVILSGAGASAATTALIAAIEALCKTPWDKAEGVVVVGINVVE